MSTGSSKSFGVPGESRTPNLLIRSQMLYPIELRALNDNIIVSKKNYSNYLRAHYEQIIFFFCLHAYIIFGICYTNL